VSKHASRRARTKGGRRRKRHNRPSLSAAARKARKARADVVKQKPVAEAELDRIGKYAIDEARSENEKRYQRRLVGSSGGQMYYKLPTGQMIKTDGRAVIQADGTLRPLPPDPRPTKRERAKARRRLKRKEK
jgi:hypothetical protein